MKISIRLMGMLKDKEPSGNVLDVDDESTIIDALAALEIDADGIHVFTINGELQREKSYVLRPDDELIVFPPVGGG